METILQHVMIIITKNIAKRVIANIINILTNDSVSSIFLRNKPGALD